MLYTNADTFGHLVGFLVVTLILALLMFPVIGVLFGFAG